MKIRTISLIVLAALAVVFDCGCTKDNPNNGGNGGGNQPNTDTINNGGGNGGGNSGGGNGGGNYEYHEYVDLGLPSGTLWATCNVGASSPEECGSRFAWGETSPKEVFNWTNYKWCVVDGNIGHVNDDGYLIDGLTKYCHDYGYLDYHDYYVPNFVDNLTILLPPDDAANTNWGNGWRMPTYEECEELIQYTTQVASSQNNVHGVTFTGENGNSIFMPVLEYAHDEGWGETYFYTMRYWSSSLYTGQWPYYHGDSRMAYCILLSTYYWYGTYYDENGNEVWGWEEGLENDTPDVDSHSRAASWYYNYSPVDGGNCIRPVRTAN